MTEDNEDLGGDPQVYTSLSDGEEGIMYCLRALTAATLRVAKAIKAANRLNGARGPE